MPETRDLNNDAFTQLLDSTFSVTLKREGRDIALKCYSLPFTTLTYVMGMVMQSSREELIKARRVVIEDVVAAGFREIDTDKLRDIALPIFAAVSSEFPHLTTRVLTDVVVGIKEEHIGLLSVADVATIVDELFHRLDLERVAEKCNSVFSQAMELVELAAKQEMVQALTTQPPSESPSQNL